MNNPRTLQEILEEEDLHISKLSRQRFPLFFCIESSDNNDLDLIEHYINGFIEKAAKEKELYDALDLHLVQYSGDNIEISQWNNRKTEIKLNRMGSTFDRTLFRAFEKVWEKISDVKKEYNKVGQKYYQPILILFSSKNTADTEDERDEIVETISKRKKIRTLAFVNVSLCGSSSPIICSHFPEDTVYISEFTDLKKLFETIEDVLNAASTSSESRDLQEILEKLISQNWNDIQKWREYL